MLYGLDFGGIDADKLARNLLGWMSEDEVREFSTYYEYITEEEEEEEEEEESGESYAEIIAKYNNKKEL